MATATPRRRCNITSQYTRVSGHGSGHANGHVGKDLTDAGTTSYAGRRGQGKYVREVGATPVLRTSRVGFAALVAPTSRTPHIQNISSADISLIRAGYKPDQFTIQH